MAEIGFVLGILVVARTAVRQIGFVSHFWLLAGRGTREIGFVSRNGGTGRAVAR